MVTSSGDVKVLDLGLARIADEQFADELTTVGQLMGTIDYMAPEQLDDAHQVDERTDVYALAATLYKLLAGVAPHQIDRREPLVVKLQRIATQPATSLSEHRPDLPESFCQFVHQALSSSPDARPSSMSALADAVADWATDANLAKTVKTATKLQRRDPKSAVNAIDPTGLVAPQSIPTVPPPRWPLVAAAGFLLLSLVLGFVIRIQTLSGELVIETAEEDVQVRILKSGQLHRSLTLTQTAQSLRLGDGEYEIEITSDADRLVVQGAEFTLDRGETRLARIVHRENKPRIAATVSSGVAETDQPTYEGKTLDQWIDVLKNERSPLRVIEGSQALSKLGTRERSDEAIKALLVAIRFHELNTRHTLDNGETVSLSSVMFDVLDACDATVVAEMLEEELAMGDVANQDFVIKCLSYRGDRLKPHASRSLLQRVNKLTNDAAEERTRFAALNAFYEIAPMAMSVSRSLEALADTNPEMQIQAAEFLVENKSHTEQMLTALRKMLGSGELESRAAAAWTLSTLGVEAKPALPDLLEILDSDDAMVQFSGVYRALLPNRHYETVSTQDAAIFAVRKIGDPSAIPALMRCWKDRAQNPRRSHPDLRDQRISVVSNANWVADAIEAISGRRPRYERDRSSGQYAVSWEVNSQPIDRWYQFALGYVAVQSDLTLDAIELLLPVASENELAFIVELIPKVRRTPREEQRILELAALEKLAGHINPAELSLAIMKRSADPLIGTDQSAIGSYQRLAIDVWSAAQDADKINGLHLLLALNFHHPIEEYVTSSIGKWLERSDNRAILNGCLSKYPSLDKFNASVGLIRLGLADESTPKLIRDVFENTPGKSEMFAMLIPIADTDPLLPQLALELLQLPSLDEINNTYKVSNRALALRNLQGAPESTHELFLPLLRELAESGKNGGEAEAATSVLDAWE